MIFVDTGAWFALSVESDPDHQSAKAFVSGNPEPFVTSDYIIDGLLTLFVVRNEKARGVEWLHSVLDQGGVDVVQVDTDCISEARRIYSSFNDKMWSFTDCTSYAIMRRHSIKTAFSFDGDFRQFGIVQVVP